MRCFAKGCCHADHLLARPVLTNHTLLCLVMPNYATWQGTCSEIGFVAGDAAAPPALAMDSTPAPVCLRLKFSSANLQQQQQQQQHKKPNLELLPAYSTPAALPASCYQSRPRQR
jgi:hypothetical protein